MAHHIRWKWHLSFVLFSVSRHPRNVLQDKEDVVAGITIPPLVYEAPHGSTAPFWITMRSSPFVFPTVCPWFVIPGRKQFVLHSDNDNIKNGPKLNLQFAAIFPAVLYSSCFVCLFYSKIIWQSKEWRKLR